MRIIDRADPLEDDDAQEENIEVHIAKSLEELVNLYNPEIYGSVYLGYDVARRRDASVVYAIGFKDGKKRSLAEIEMRNTTFEEQLNIIRAIMKNLPVVRCCMDMTGMGEPLHETLSKEFGDKVEGIPFTSENKEILAVAVKRGLENHEFLLPNIQSFHLQIHSIKREATLVGRFRYDAERTEKGHADSFWAWALANHAVSKQGAAVKGFYEQIREKKNAGLLKSQSVPAVAVNIPEPRQRGKTAAQVLRKMGLRGL
jgi:phage FluMu gp28-like protein